MSFSISSSERTAGKDPTAGRRQAALFVGVFVALFLIVAALYWATRIYFVRTGDLLPMQTAARSLVARKGNCLYRNVLSSRTHHLFKRELLNAHQRTPRVIALGSSRMLLFHARMFNASFLNLGRAANRLKEALFMLDVLRTLPQPPEVVLLGVDFWWFHPRRSRHPGQTLNPRDITPENFGDVMQMLQKALRHPAYITEPWRRESCSIGVDAILHERGFDRWGFMYMGHLPAASHRVGFGDVLRRIQKGRDKFEPGTEPDREMLAAFIRSLQALQESGVLVIAFMPPLPAAVIQAMAERGDYTYVARVRSALAASGIPFVDFSQRPDGFHACQFVDGLHQGDTINAAILLQLAEKVPTLQAYLDVRFLHWLAGYRQNALVLNAMRLKRPEEDFLGLGCRKARVEPAR